MSNDRQLNYVNNLQNRDQKLYYVDDASELNSINLEENDKIYAINDNKLFQMEIADQEEELSGSIVSFNGRNNTKIKSVTVNIKPVQDLHGYDKPWPAGSGKNMSHLMIINRSGANYKNLLDESVTIYSDLTAPAYRFCRFRLIDSLEELAGQTVSLSAKATQVQGPSSPRMMCRLYKADGSTTVGDIIFDITSTNISQSFMLPSEIESGTMLCLNLYCDSSSGSPSETKFYDIQLELGNSVTTFAPYKNICPISGWTGAVISRSGADTSDADTISVNWEAEAGTVYGGEDEVISGKLKSTMGMVDLGTLTWRMNTLGQFFATLPIAGVDDTTGSNVKCSVYKGGNAYGNENHTICVTGTSGLNVWVKDTNFTDATSFKESLSDQQLCYELATPGEYNFTQTELTILYGTNNIWADIGDITVKISEKSVTAFELKPHT